MASRRERGKQLFKEVTQFPEAIELLVRGLRSGLPVTETLGVVAAEVPGPVGEEFKLVSIQNIQSELEEKEMEAWQNLVRVLTHEIMNSITPITSLATTIERCSSSSC